MDNFKSTYLYIKQHSVTGMLYFGKTTRSENFLLEKYNGSGKHWNNHLKKHGTDFIKTLWYNKFTNKDDCVEFATFFSEFFDIVKSKKWANEKNENGIDGGSTGRHGWNPSKETRLLWSKQRAGRTASAETRHKMSMKREGKNNYFYGKTGADHPLTGFKHSDEERAARADRNSDYWEIQYPCGKILQTKGLMKFCRENNLSYYQLYNSRNGWKIKKVKNNEN